MSKATVSKHVTMLEAQMGVRLLNRTTRTLGLTAVGARFYARCQHIVTELNAAQTEVMRCTAEPYGKLRVTASPSIGRLHVAPVLREFLDRYRNIEIHFSLSDHDTGLVEEGFDVAILVARQALPSPQYVRLALCAQVICAAPDYLDCHGRPETPEDLLRHNCMTCDEPSNGEAWRLEGPNGPLSIKVKGRLRTNNGDALRMAVLSGFGLALIPLFLVNADLEAGRLRRVLPQYVDFSHFVYVVCPGQSPVAPNVKVFVEFLKLRLGTSPCQASMSGARLASPVFG
jgi:DNA-binding transcriptional LysR family regulator